jgi:small subunit ribosomal protein S6
MAKNKKVEIPHYELLYIISNKFTEEEIVPIAQKVEKIITDNNGIITHKEVWGKKKLSYAIKHFSHGYYNLIEFDVPGNELASIDKLMRLSSEILRHQIVTKKARTEEEIRKEKAKLEEMAKEEVKKEKQDIVEEKVEEKKKPKVDLQDLDEKLDRILETDDLL